jgi:hypothetical protein
MHIHVCAHTPPHTCTHRKHTLLAHTRTHTALTHNRADTQSHTNGQTLHTHACTHTRTDTCLFPHTYPHMQTHPSQTLKATFPHVVKGPQICAHILYTHAPTHCSQTNARKNATTNMHIHVCAHTPPHTYGHTHFTHKRAHTRGRTHCCCHVH